jgi:hypothetical protein
VKKRQSALRLPGIRRFRIATMSSSSVQSVCSSTRARIFSAWASSADRLPPRGLGAQILSFLHDCSHLIAELTLTSKRSAASRRDAPTSTASITRSRKSDE